MRWPRSSMRNGTLVMRGFLLNHGGGGATFMLNKPAVK